MTPREFLEQVVRPNEAEFEANFGSVRHAHNAVASVDALAARLYHSLKASSQSATGAKDDSAYRQQLADANADFGVLRDLAKANKHFVLTQGQPKISSAAQVTVEAPGWGEARWDEARWDSPDQVHVRLNSGDLRAVDYLVRAGIAFLDTEMAKHGI
ncbi:MAG: hypothetical protein ACYC0C_16905 [Devosia sp.]